MAAKNAGSGFSSAQALARRDQVEGHPDLAEQRLDALRLVAGDADPVARLPEIPERSDRVRVQVPLLDDVRDAGGLALAARHSQVEVGAQDPERLPMVAAAFDHGADHAEERQGLDAQPVGPFEPQPVLVDQRLADVEHDGTDGRQVRGRRGQRERSCQLTPPSGAPGSFGCGAPVRLSTCSTPRR